MSASIFFAQFWGIFLIVFPLAFLLRRENVKGIVELVGDGRHTPVFGLMSFLLGLWTVLLHNVWVGDWRIVITIFGWLGLLKGISYLLWPEVIKRSAKLYKNAATANLLLLVAIALGVWLTYIGFTA